MPCNKLIINPEQPFRLYNEEQLKDLAERINRCGLLEPITVRPVSEGKYEILSGRNRARAVMLNGEKEIKAFVRKVSDDEAMLIMLDANLGQREGLSPSEKAFAYRMEADILNRQGKRPESTSGKMCQKFNARKIMSDKHSESERNISNYIRLSYLISELLTLVDEKKLPILSGVELSYLEEKIQKYLLDNYIAKGIKLTVAQISEIRKIPANSNTVATSIYRIMDNKKEKSSGFIKLDKAKFSKFSSIIENTPRLEKLFIEFLESYKQSNKGKPANKSQPLK